MLPLSPLGVCCPRPLKSTYLETESFLRPNLNCPEALAPLEATGAGSARARAFFAMERQPRCYHELLSPQMTVQWLAWVGRGNKTGRGGSLEEKHQEPDSKTIRKSWKEPKCLSEGNWFCCGSSNTLKHGGLVRCDVVEDSVAHNNCWFSWSLWKTQTTQSTSDSGVYLCLF